MHQDLNRRRFLGAAAGTGAALAAAGAMSPSAIAGKRARASQQGAGDGENRPSASNIGIQLYTMRRLMPSGDRRAVRSVLNALGAMGYRTVEMAGYYGFEARQVRNWVEAAGLRAVSGHDGFDLDPANTNWAEAYKATLQNAVTMGQEYTGLAYFGPPYNEVRFKQIAARMNEAGQLARDAGLQFFYHNHDFEFSNKQADGTPLYDIFLEETDRDLVKFELDLYWIVVGGENPLAYLSADPERYPLYHVKDKTWKDRPNAQDWEDVGPGSIDFEDIFEVGATRGLRKHYIVEHDSPQLSHPGDPEAELKTAQAGINYLRQVNWRDVTWLEMYEKDV